MMTRRTHTVVALTASTMLSSSLASAAPRNGDLLIAEELTGAILVIDPATGLVRETLSGADLLSEEDPEGGPFVGAGPLFLEDDGGDVSLSVIDGRRLIAGFSDARFSAGQHLFEVDPFTGARSPIVAFDGSISSGEAWTDDGIDFVLTDQRFNEEFGRIFRYSRNGAPLELLSGAGRGEGPLIVYPEAFAFASDGAILVPEGHSSAGSFVLSSSPLTEAALLVEVDPATGDRRIVSRIGVRLDGETGVVRRVASGASDGLVVDDGDFGSGPVSELAVRSVIEIDGEIYVGGDVFVPEIDGLEGPWHGCILRIDRETGDRELVLGIAFADDGTTDNPATAFPLNDPDFYFESPVGFVEGPDGRPYFTQRFNPAFVHAWDPRAKTIELITDLSGQLDPSWGSQFAFTDLTFYEGTACRSDFDAEGDVDFQDLLLLASAFGGAQGDDGFVIDRDLDDDGAIGLGDFDILASDFGLDGCLD